jgi:hypothetical protein
MSPQEFYVISRHNLGVESVLWKMPARRGGCKRELKRYDGAYPARLNIESGSRSVQIFLLPKLLFERGRGTNLFVKIINHQQRSSRA